MKQENIEKYQKRHKESKKQRYRYKSVFDEDSKRFKIRKNQQQVIDYEEEYDDSNL